ncbi:unnamed protein product, partial [Heterotrigona itama]
MVIHRFQTVLKRVGERGISTNLRKVRNRQTPDLSSSVRKGDRDVKPMRRLTMLSCSMQGNRRRAASTCSKLYVGSGHVGELSKLANEARERGETCTYIILSTQHTFHHPVLVGLRTCELCQAFRRGKVFVCLVRSLYG